MINILWLIPATIIGAILGIFTKCSLFSGVKYDSEIYEFNLKKLQKKIDELEEQIKNK